jgi:hypothetical protein
LHEFRILYSIERVWIPIANNSVDVSEQLKRDRLEGNLAGAPVVSLFFMAMETPFGRFAALELVHYEGREEARCVFSSAEDAK